MLNALDRQIIKSKQKAVLLIFQVFYMKFLAGLQPNNKQQNRRKRFFFGFGFKIIALHQNNL